MVIRLRMGIPGNWLGARCRQLQIWTWRDDPPFDGEQQDDMIAFCNEPDPCPIRHDCLVFALMNNCTDGVWGGMSPEDRRALRKKYPLGLGTRNEQGILEFHPRPEWQWHPPTQRERTVTAHDSDQG